MAGADLIAAERLRQVAEEGRTAEHDDEHVDGALGRAALSYLAAAVTTGEFGTEAAGEVWPWERTGEPWRHPVGDRVRRLVKAGALIAAEIDRIERESSARR